MPSAWSELRRRATMVCMKPLFVLLSATLVAAAQDLQDLNEKLREEVRDGHYQRAEALLENPRVDPDSQDRDGFTALMYAAREDRPELVTLLIKAGTNLDLQNNGRETALILAVKRGRVDATRLLLMAGADTEPTDRRGRTALDWAVERNRTYLAQIVRIAKSPTDVRITIAEQPLAGPAESLVPPRLVRETPPLYTESAFDDGIEGRVVLKIIVRKDGSVGPIRIHQSLERELDQAAVEAVKTWEFEPAKIDGEPVNVLADVEIDFVITRG